MFADSNSYYDNNVKRFSLSIGAAILAHALILAWFSYAPASKVLDSNLASSPTNITVSFLNVQKETLQVKRTAPAHSPKIVKKEVEKKAAITPDKIPAEQLNKIAPAASKQQAQKSVEKTKPIHQMNPVAPAPTVIPVVSDTHVKGRRVKPKYPDRALRMGQEGVVWLHVLISETGARKDIKIHKSTKYALLNQAAVKAVKKWTFDPNIVNGQAIKSWVEIPIEFKIQ